MTRIGDQTIADLERSIEGLRDAFGCEVSVRVMRAMLGELKERRSIDMTSKEIGALEWLRVYASKRMKHEGIIDQDYAADALSVLDRLIKGANRGE